MKVHFLFGRIISGKYSVKVDEMTEKFGLPRNKISNDMVVQQIQNFSKTDQNGYSFYSGYFSKILNKKIYSPEATQDEVELPQGIFEEGIYIRLAFDFSKTTSSLEIETYGLESMDGTQSITVDADVASSVLYAFDEHGIHNVTLFAVDASGVKTSQEVSIRVDLRIDWSETKTNDPAVLPFNPTPSNGGIHPIAIEIESTVENPSLIDGIGGGGQTVEFSWAIVDELDDTCQSKGGQAVDGGEDTWQTIHFNTYLLHELRIVPEEGQDYLNIQQTVSVLYSSD